MLTLQKITALLSLQLTMDTQDQMKHFTQLLMMH